MLKSRERYLQNICKRDHLNPFNTAYFKFGQGNDHSISIMAEIPRAIRLITRSHEPLTSTNCPIEAREVGSQDAEYYSYPDGIDSEISGVRVGLVENTSQ
jgi:hypothetical protein